MFITEIYFHTQASLHELAAQLRTTCNWPETNANTASQLYTTEEYPEHLRIQTLGMEFWLVPNTGNFLIDSYRQYSYYLFLRWNPVDREEASVVQSPLLRILANLFYRSGYEIEVDHILKTKQRERIKAQDPVLEIEQELSGEKELW